MFPILSCLLIAAPTTVPSVNERAHSFVQEFMKGKRPAALVVGYYRDRTSNFITAGLATTPTGTALPTHTTLFEFGSITKIFTGTLLAIAIERKEVALDDPL
ncbi:MAG: serine hydrolase, partial [Gemmataceae bacterium]